MRRSARCCSSAAAAAAAAGVGDDDDDAVASLADALCRFDVGLASQRLRRWPNIKPAQGRFFHGISWRCKAFPHPPARPGLRLSIHGRTTDAGHTFRPLRISISPRYYFYSSIRPWTHFWWYWSEHGDGDRPSHYDIGCFGSPLVHDDRNTAPGHKSGIFWVVLFFTNEQAHGCMWMTVRPAIHARSAPLKDRRVFQAVGCCHYLWLYSCADNDMLELEYLES